MMAQTGAFMVLSRLPSDRCGSSRSLAARDFTKMKRAGLQLAEVGPSFMRSTSSCSSASGTSLVQPGIMRARLAEQLVEAGVGKSLALKPGEPLAPLG